MKILNKLDLRILLSFSIRVVAILAQLFSISIIAQFMPNTFLAQFFSIVAFCSTIVSITDLGFLRYSLRYSLHKKNNEHSQPIVIARYVQIVFIVLLLSIPIIILFYKFSGYSVAFIILTLASGLLSQAMNISRYKLISDDRLLTCQSIEMSQPIFLIISILLFLIWAKHAKMLPADAIGWIIYFLYFVSFLSAFALSVAASRSWAHWKRGVQLLFSRPERGAVRPVLRTIRRSFLVGVDSSLMTVWMNATLLAVDRFAGAEVTAILGVHRRLINVANGFFGIAVQYDLKKMYSAKHQRRLTLKAVAWSASIFALVAIGSYAFEAFQLGPGAQFVARYEILVFMGKLNYPILNALAVSFLYAFLHVSFQALGANLKGVRVIADIIGISVLTMILAIVLSVGGRDPGQIVKGAIGALAASMSAGLLYLIFQSAIKRPRRAARIGRPQHE